MSLYFVAMRAAVKNESKFSFDFPEFPFSFNFYPCLLQNEYWESLTDPEFEEILKTIPAL